MKLHCHFCNRPFRVSRLWFYIQYLLHTREIYSSDDFGANQYRKTYTCPSCGSKVAYLFYMRTSQDFTRSKKRE